MRFPRLPEFLVTPVHGTTILAGVGLLASLLWPDPHIRRSLFLQVLVVLQGILAIQVGEGEHGYGPATPKIRLMRFLFFDALSLVLVLPLLLVHKAETGASWPAFLLALTFLALHNLVWICIGHGLARWIRFEALRFVLKYGGLLAVLFVPVFLACPISALTTLPALWDGEALGKVGLLLYLGISGVSVLWSMRPGKSGRG